MKTLAERIEEKIERIPESGCHIWMASCFWTGYAQIKTGGKNRSVHRVSWELANGPIPDGMQVCHRCDIKTCCNPNHLFLGTNADNVADKVSKDRQQKGMDYGRAKLTDDQVMSICLDSRAESSIASEYCISRSLVGQIKRREIWPHILKAKAESGEMLETFKV